MSFYESIYLIRPNLTTEQYQVVADQVREYIENLGGKILRTEVWGRRSLAYPVDKHNKAFYVYNVLEGEKDMVRNLEDRLNISEDVIKYMTVRVDAPPEGPSPMADEGRPETAGGRDRGRVRDDLDLVDVPDLDADSDMDDED